MEESEARLEQDVARLNERLAATRARLAAQDERLARLREEIKSMRDRREDAPPRRQAAPQRRQSMLPELALLAVTLLVALFRGGLFVRAQSAARLKDAVAAIAEAPRSSVPLPAGDNDVAVGLRLVYAYEPTAANVTVGEILEPLLGPKLSPSSFDVLPITASAFWVVFRPYSEELGLSREYRFRVDASAGLVQPTPETTALLRADAAGLLASRSDFQGFRKALDLSGDDEVVVGKPADRMGR